MFQHFSQGTADPPEVGYVMSRLQLPRGREDPLEADRIQELKMGPAVETVAGSIMSSRSLGVVLRHSPRPYLHSLEEALR